MSMKVTYLVEIFGAVPVDGVAARVEHESGVFTRENLATGILAMFDSLAARGVPATESKKYGRRVGNIKVSPMVDGELLSIGDPPYAYTTLPRELKVGGKRLFHGFMPALTFEQNVERVSTKLLEEHYADWQAAVADGYTGNFDAWMKVPFGSKGDWRGLLTAGDEKEWI